MLSIDAAQDDRERARRDIADLQIENAEMQAALRAYERGKGELQHQIDELKHELNSQIHLRYALFQSAALFYQPILQIICTTDS